MSDNRSTRSLIDRTPVVLMLGAAVLVLELVASMTMKAGKIVGDAERFRRVFDRQTVHGKPIMVKD